MGDDGGFGMGVNSRGFDPRTVAPAASGFGAASRFGAASGFGTSSGFGAASGFGASAPRAEAGAGSVLGVPMSGGPGTLAYREAEALRREVAEYDDVGISLYEEYDQLYENALYSVPFVPATLSISELLSVSADDIDTNPHISSVVASAISYNNILDDIQLPMFGGGQRGGAFLEDEATTVGQANAAAFAAVKIDETNGNALLEAEATSESLVGAASEILKWKIAETTGEAVAMGIATEATSGLEHTAIIQTQVNHIATQKKNAKAKFNVEREVLGSRSLRSSTPAAVAEREARARRIAAEAEAKAAARAREKAAEEAKKMEKVAIAEASRLRAPLESNIQTLASASTLRRRHSLGAGAMTNAGKKGKEGGGARASALKAIESTSNTLSALYVPKGRWSSAFKCYICGTDILGAAHFEHTFDFYSAMSKKFLYFPGQSDVEKMIQRCLGEWAHAYCNSTAKSNIDLTNNVTLGIDRADWGDLRANENAITDMLTTIWLNKSSVDASPQLNEEYSSLTDFVSRRKPYVKARINMSCIIAKTFVIWGKYQLVKKIIYLSVKDWIMKGKPADTQLQQKLCRIMNAHEYNPLNEAAVSSLSEPLKRLMNSPTMYLNVPSDPTEQSVDDETLHPATPEETHGGQIMRALGIEPASLMAGGRRKKNKKRFTMMAKRKAKRSTRRQARNRRS